MIDIDDFFFGLLISGIITLANRKDERFDKEQKKRLEELRKRAELLRNPDADYPPFPPKTQSGSLLIVFGVEQNISHSA